MNNDPKERIASYQDHSLKELTSYLRKFGFEYLHSLSELINHNRTITFTHVFRNGIKAFEFTGYIHTGKAHSSRDIGYQFSFGIINSKHYLYYIDTYESVYNDDLQAKLKKFHAKTGNAGVIQGASQAQDHHLVIEAVINDIEGPAIIPEVKEFLLKNEDILMKELKDLSTIQHLNKSSWKPEIDHPSNSNIRIAVIIIVSLIILSAAYMNSKRDDIKIARQQKEQLKDQELTRKMEEYQTRNLKDISGGVEDVQSSHPPANGDIPPPPPTANKRAIKSPDRNRLLIEALQNNDLNAVLSAVKNGSDPQLTDHKHSNLLHYAASYDMQGELTQKLIDENVNINAVETEKGGVPLHSAVFVGNMQFIRKALSIGADFNAKDARNKTLLISAAQGNQTEVIEYLLSLGVLEPEEKDKRGMSALDYARGHNNQEAMKLINDYIESKK